MSLNRNHKVLYGQVGDIVCIYNYSLEGKKNRSKQI